MKQFQLRLVAEKAGLVDRQIFQQLGQFRLAFLADQQTVVAVERIQVAFLESALQAVLKEMGAAFVEVHAALLVDEGLQELEFSFRDLRRDRGCAHRFEFVLAPLPEDRYLAATALCASLFPASGSVLRASLLSNSLDMSSSTISRP